MMEFRVIKNNFSLLYIDSFLDESELSKYIYMVSFFIFINLYGVHCLVCLSYSVASRELAKQQFGDIRVQCYSPDGAPKREGGAHSGSGG